MFGTNEWVTEAKSLLFGQLNHLARARCKLPQLVSPINARLHLRSFSDIQANYRERYTTTAAQTRNRRRVVGVTKVPAGTDACEKRRGLPLCLWQANQV